MEGATPLRKEQDEVYRKALDEMKRQIADIDHRTEEEIRLVKAKLSALQDTKKILIAACSGITRILGQAPVEENEDMARPDAATAGRGSG